MQQFDKKQYINKYLKDFQDGKCSFEKYLEIRNFPRSKFIQSQLKGMFEDDDKESYIKIQKLFISKLVEQEKKQQYDQQMKKRTHYLWDRIRNKVFQKVDQRKQIIQQIAQANQIQNEQSQVTPRCQRILHGQSLIKDYDSKSDENLIQKHMNEGNITIQKKNMYKSYFNHIASQGYKNLCEEFNQLEKKKPVQTLNTVNKSKSSSKIVSSEGQLPLIKSQKQFIKNIEDIETQQKNQEYLLKKYLRQPVQKSNVLNSIRQRDKNLIHLSDLDSYDEQNMQRYLTQRNLGGSSSLITKSFKRQHQKNQTKSLSKEQYMQDLNVNELSDDSEMPSVTELKLSDLYQQSKKTKIKLIKQQSGFKNPILLTIFKEKIEQRLNNMNRNIEFIHANKLKRK